MDQAAFQTTEQQVKENRKLLSRRDLLKRGALAGAGLVAAPMFNRGRFRIFANSPVEYTSRAIDMVQQSLVIDMLGPFTLNLANQGQWFTNPESFTVADLQPYKDSDINVFHVATGLGGPDAYDRTLRMFASWNGFIANHDQNFMRIDSAADLNRVKTSGKIGICIGLQNSEQFRRPEDVDFFHGIGQRVSQLTYNARNLIGNGS